MHYFGAPQVILSDNGTAFVARAFGDFLRMIGANWMPMSEYSPRSNGRAEWMVRTVKTAVAKITWTTGGDWDDLVEPVLSGYRMRQGKTGVSPFFLLYGVEERLPELCVQIPNDQTENGDDVNEWARLLELATTMGARAEVMGRIRIVGEDKTESFVYGDMVLMWSAHETGPLRLKWLGLYRVERPTHPTYQLRWDDGKRSRRVTHVARLKKYFPRPFRREDAPGFQGGVMLGVESGVGNSATEVAQETPVCEQ